MAAEFRLFFHEPTLVGSFFNFRFHTNMVEMAATRQLWSFPLPAMAARADSPVKREHPGTPPENGILRLSRTKSSEDDCFPSPAKFGCRTDAEIV